MRTRTWYLEINGNPDHDDHLHYLVHLSDKDAFALSEDLMGLAKQGKFATFKMDPADTLGISLAQIRERLGIGLGLSH